MTDKPLCPKCGRPLVWLSSPQALKCFKCEKPPEDVPLPWWVWVFVAIGLGLVLALIIMAINFPPGGGGGITNLTQTAEDPDLAFAWALAWFVVILAFGMGVAYAMERGKERCPACGEVLRLVQEVQKYKCLHCGSWYPREDIEVEVVE